MISDHPNQLRIPAGHYDAARRLSPSPSPSDFSSRSAGEVAPALSPLDVFAQHSRLLAQKFEEERQRGRRISRLPPLTVAREFSASKPGHFRSLSEESISTTEGARPSEKIKERTKAYVAEDIRSSPKSATRPKSQYPVVQDDSAGRKYIDKSLTFSKQDTSTTIAQKDFAYLHSASPEPLGKERDGERPTEARIGLRFPGNPSRNVSPAYLRVGNGTPNASPLMGPSRSPAAPRSPWSSSSIRSVPPEGPQHVEGPSLADSYDSIQSQNRANGCSFSINSPISPLPHSIPRPPSAASSQYSISSSRHPRPSLNFSRPRSSASQTPADARPSIDSRPSLERQSSMEPPSRKDSDKSTSTISFADALSRQNSQDGPFPTPSRSDSANTPTSMMSEDYFTSREQPVPSYIYRKYSLPRGRQVDRNSIPASEFLSKQFAAAETNSFKLREQANHIKPYRPPSPPESPRTVQLTRPRLLGAGSDAAQRSRSTGLLEPLEKSSMNRVAMSPAPSTDTEGATLKAQVKSRPSTVELSAQTHLDKGIELHEQGALQESTYHLRLAARAGEPTGMLLYALACRHGWGMRSNQAEGVSWLRKAVDIIGVDVTDGDGDTALGNANEAALLNLPDRKARKAQFALGIYELGVSYMNGWGIAQDRSLAVRCFEVAGNWGDADALAEAGYCYTEGLGCKKNLFKAARFYRAAAAKGISMAGNSW